MNSFSKTHIAGAVKIIVVSSLSINFAISTTTQAASPSIKKDEPAMISAQDMKVRSTSAHSMRATELIGMKVTGSGGKSVGEIKDLIVNVNTGDVRYALLEFDPGFFKAEKLFAVPLKDLSLDAQKVLHYGNVSRKKMENAGVEKADWKKAVDNRRYIAGLDQNYGFTPPAGTSRSFRASELIGKDVNSRAGKDIGDIKELVIDMGAGRISYAVLAFDPSWTSSEKLYAFPVTAFNLDPDKDNLILDVEKSIVESMKVFDTKQWSHLNDLNHDAFVNKVPMNNKK